MILEAVTKISMESRDITERSELWRSRRSGILEAAAIYVRDASL